jgi:L-malate glycosyltransferase
VVDKMIRKKIKVLHLAKIVSRNDFVDSIVSNLDPGKFDVLVVTLTDSSLTFSPVYKEKGIPHINLNITNHWKFQQILPALSKIIKKHQVDIIHTHLFEEQFTGAFLKLRFPKLKFIIGRHYSDEIYLLHKGLKKKTWIAIENFANNKADVIVAGSQMVKKILLKQGIKASKIASIPYGFDFDDHRYQTNALEQTASIRETYNVKEEDILLVNVGRLFNLKGQTLLIDVLEDLCKKYNNLKLLIIGDGPDKKMLQDKVDAARLNDKVIFTGWLKNAHQYISAADIVVHPTLSEMFSQLMIETMALGKPLIINDVSAVQDVIKNKVNGIICQHQHEDWYNSISFLIENETIRTEIGKNAEEHVKATYPISSIKHQYELLYENLNNNEAFIYRELGFK